MADGRGQAEIRTSFPLDREDKFDSLVAQEVKTIKKDRVDLDA